MFVSKSNLNVLLLTNWVDWNTQLWIGTPGNSSIKESVPRICLEFAIHIPCVAGRKTLELQIGCDNNDTITWIIIDLVLVMHGRCGHTTIIIWVAQTATVVNGSYNDTIIWITWIASFGDRIGRVRWFERIFANFVKSSSIAIKGWQAYGRWWVNLKFCFINCFFALFLVYSANSGD